MGNWGFDLFRSRLFSRQGIDYQCWRNEENVEKYWAGRIKRDRQEDGRNIEQEVNRERQKCLLREEEMP